MTNKDIILKSIKYIEKNLKDEISVLDMAGSANYSLYHFIRLFQSVTGYSPKIYLQRRRLSEALIELQNADKKIIEIAFDYQFNSHEAFSRAFKKRFGINPKNVKDGHSSLNLRILNPIDDNYLFQSEKARNGPPQVIELHRKYLTGISFFLANDCKVCDLSRQWDQLRREVDTIKDRLKPERFYQVQYWSDKQDLEGLYFFIGVEVKSIKDVRPEFVVKILPQSRYLKFIHKGLANKVGYTYNYIYNQFLPETEYKLTKPFSFEFYGEKCLGPYNPESESEIYIPIQ